MRQSKPFPFMVLSDSNHTKNDNTASFKGNSFYGTCEMWCISKLTSNKFSIIVISCKFLNDKMTLLVSFVCGKLFSSLYRDCVCQKKTAKETKISSLYFLHTDFDGEYTNYFEEASEFVYNRKRVNVSYRYETSGFFFNSISKYKHFLFSI